MQQNSNHGFKPAAHLADNALQMIVMQSRVNDLLTHCNK